MKYTTKPSVAPQRRAGIVLLVVIAMLTLFAAVALSFVFYAEAESTAAQITRTSLTQVVADVEPEQLFSYFLSQIIYDTANPFSAARGHGLARGVYGYNPGIGAVNSTPHNGFGRFPQVISLNIPGGNPLDTPPGSVPAQRTSWRVFVPPGNGVPPPGVFVDIPFDNTNFINYTDYSASTTDNLLVGGAIAGNQPKRSPEAYFDPVSNVTSYIGTNASYTYPDLNNVLLASVDANFDVLIPSGYRDWNANKFSNGPGYSYWADTNPYAKYLSLRPHKSYHTAMVNGVKVSFPDPEDGFADVRNLDFSQGWKQQSGPNAGSFAINDSFWMDLGFQVLVAPNGKKYKPLVAPLMIDLDNRVNLWVSGNRKGAGNTHGSNHAFGPSEISLFSPTNPLPVIPSQADVNNLFTLRYGNNMATNQAYPPASALLTQNAPYYTAIDFDAQHTGGRLMPWTNTLAPAHVFVFPPPATIPPGNVLFPPFSLNNVGWNDAKNSALGMELINNNLAYRVYNQNPATSKSYVNTALNLDARPISAAEMEPILRFQGKGSFGLGAALLNTMPNSLGATIPNPPPPAGVLTPAQQAALRSRGLVTTHSWYINRPTGSPMFNLDLDSTSTAKIATQLSTSTGSGTITAATPVSGGGGSSGTLLTTASLPAAGDIVTIANLPGANGTWVVTPDVSGTGFVIPVTSITMPVVPPAPAPTWNSIVSGFSITPLGPQNTPLTPGQISATSAPGVGPILITTSTNHNLVSGALVSITNVAGNTAANGTWNVIVPPGSPNTFFLKTPSIGNGTYVANTGNWLTLNPSPYQIAQLTAPLIPKTPVTVTTMANHNLATGSVVTISGLNAANSAANGTWTITTTGDNTFTIPATLLPVPPFIGATWQLNVRNPIVTATAPLQTTSPAPPSGEYGSDGQSRLVQGLQNAASGVINAISVGTPMTVTSYGHGLQVGPDNPLQPDMYLIISGARVNNPVVHNDSSANGIWGVWVIDQNTIKLPNGLASNGIYQGGGVWQALPGGPVSNAATPFPTITINNPLLAPLNFGNITAMTGLGVNPTKITIPGHGLRNNTLINIAGVPGNTAVNGTWIATVIDKNTISVPVTGTGIFPPVPPLLPSHAGTWRVVPYLKPNLFAPNLPQYPTTFVGNGAFNLAPALKLQYEQALHARQILAMQIFKTLLKATGTQDPNTAASVSSNSNAYAAARWLAQIAVNLVDYIDDDEYMTPFNFATWQDYTTSPPTTYYDWVIGTEMPRLVLNEVYAQYDNDPADIGAVNLAKPATMWPVSYYNLNVWVELLNPLRTMADVSRDNGTVNLNEGGSPAYQIVLAQPDPSERKYDVINGLPQSPTSGKVTRYRGTGQPSSALATGAGFPQFQGNYDGTGTTAPFAWGAAGQVLPVNEAVTGLKAGNTGFYVIGPSAGFIKTKALNLNPNLPTTSKSNLMTYKATSNSLFNPTVYLQRLANPRMPVQTDPTKAYFNPYVTIDYIEDVPYMDNRFNLIGTGVSNAAYGGPPTNFFSVGKRQPYGALMRYKYNTSKKTPVPYQVDGPAVTPIGSTSQVIPQATVHAGQPKNTFFAHNLLNPANPTDNKNPLQTLKIPFDWLVHLDRPPVNTMELRYVSEYRPHELTQQFISSVGTVSQYGPWTDTTIQMYRAMELNGGPGRMAGLGVNSREPGRINLNTNNSALDPEILLALCDSQAISAFTPVNVKTMATNLAATIRPGDNIATRTAGDYGYGNYQVPTGSPSAQDRPIRSLSTGNINKRDSMYPNGISMSDTLLGGTFSLGAGVNLYQQNELLQKITNNATTTSNVFAVWMTVGFFEVTDDTVLPVKLGAELGRSENKQIRHRFFAIVDRSEVAMIRDTTRAQIPVTSPPTPASFHLSTGWVPNTVLNQWVDIIDPSTGATEAAQITGLDYTNGVTGSMSNNPTLTATFSNPVAPPYNAGSIVVWRANPGPQPVTYQSVIYEPSLKNKYGPGKVALPVKGLVTSKMIGQLIKISDSSTGNSEYVQLTDIFTFDPNNSNVNASNPELNLTLTKGYNPLTTTITWVDILYNPRNDPYVVQHWSVIE